MANCVKYRFSINLQFFSVVLKSAPVKYVTTYCPWDSHQIDSSCTSMSLWWQNDPTLWLSWTVTIPKWVSILWRVACAPSDAKLLEGGVYIYVCVCVCACGVASDKTNDALIGFEIAKTYSFDINHFKEVVSIKMYNLIIMVMYRVYG